MTTLTMFRRVAFVVALTLALLPFSLAAQAPPGGAAEQHRPGGEVNIHLPDLHQGDFLGMTGHEILLSGLVVCVLGLMFGAWTYAGVKRMPVHRSMADISELIYETCKAYLI
jgi:K(+)-stimulated pyrophosphate-energized sodium pump